MTDKVAAPDAGDDQSTRFTPETIETTDRNPTVAGDSVRVTIPATNQPPDQEDVSMPEESGGCSGTASCQFKSAMEFAFADMIQDYKHAAARRRDVNDFISSQVQVAHLGEGIKVGTREAAAMQRMDADKSAGKLMEHTLALAAAKNA